MFLGPHKMKMSNYFLVSDTLLNLGLFLISEDPPSNFELFTTETWDFFDFLIFCVVYLGAINMYHEMEIPNENLILHPLSVFQ